VLGQRDQQRDSLRCVRNANDTGLDRLLLASRCSVGWLLAGSLCINRRCCCPGCGCGRRRRRRRFMLLAVLQKLQWLASLRSPREFLSDEPREFARRVRKQKPLSRLEKNRSSLFARSGTVRQASFIFPHSRWRCQHAATSYSTGARDPRRTHKKQTKQPRSEQPSNTVIHTGRVQYDG